MAKNDLKDNSVVVLSDLSSRIDEIVSRVVSIVEVKNDDKNIKIEIDIDFGNTQAVIDRFEVHL